MDARRDRGLDREGISARIRHRVAGEGQSIALAAVLLLAVLAMGGIWHFVTAASHEDAAALAHEKAVAHLHVLLRGLNESVVSQRSHASVDLTQHAMGAFDAMVPALAEADPA
ncbi:MAG TPA: hypothetical protein VFP36_14460, partial [Usitatibacter sp.]|nr:hypothetical protein [Usitatibacter sp.]